MNLARAELLGILYDAGFSLMKDMCGHDYMVLLTPDGYLVCCSLFSFNLFLFGTRYAPSTPSLDEYHDVYMVVPESGERIKYYPIPLGDTGGKSLMQSAKIADLRSKIWETRLSWM